MPEDELLGTHDSRIGNDRIKRSAKTGDDIDRTNNRGDIFEVTSDWSCQASRSIAGVASALERPCQSDDTRAMRGKRSNGLETNTRVASCNQDRASREVKTRKNFVCRGRAIMGVSFMHEVGFPLGR
jgi:hypothetical protein